MVPFCPGVLKGREELNKKETESPGTVDFFTASLPAA